LRSVFIDRLVKDPTILQGDQSAVVSSILGALDPLQYISQRLNANFSELNEKIVQQSLAYQNSIDLQRQLLSIESRSISQRVSRIDIFRQLGATDFDVDEILKGISKDIRSSEFFGNTDEITNNLRLLAGQVKEAERVITAFNAGDLDTVSKFPGGIEEANRILIDYNRNQERLNQTIAKTDEDLSILRSRFQNLANISSRLRESLISRGRLNFGERLQSQFFSQQFENTIGNRLFDRGGIF